VIQVLGEANIVYSGCPLYFSNGVLKQLNGYIINSCSFMTPEYVFSPILDQFSHHGPL